LCIVRLIHTLINRAILAISILNNCPLFPQWEIVLSANYGDDLGDSVIHIDKRASSSRYYLFIDNDIDSCDDRRACSSDHRRRSRHLDDQSLSLSPSPPLSLSLSLSLGRRVTVQVEKVVPASPSFSSCSTTLTIRREDETDE